MPLGRSRLVTDLKVRLKRSRLLQGVSRRGLEIFRAGWIRAVRLVKGIDREQVVFSSLMARNYGDNLKPISELLHEKRPQAKIVWMFRDPAAKKGIVPDYVTCLDPISLKGMAAYATAKVWVDNFTLGRHLVRRRGKQFYLNTWHGDRTFKKYGYDAFPNQPRRMEENCDLMLSGSAFGDRVLRSAMRYEGELLTMGCPRNDCLVHPDPAAAARIREKLGVAEGTRLLVYCPTFRASIKWEAFRDDLNLEQALDDLQQATGDRWECLFRAHHLALGGLDLKEGGRLRDVSGYEDMADLLLISDALITDYSSAAMDFALLGRRVFIYQDDLEDYTANDRQLHFRKEDSPFLTAHDQKELSDLIARTSDEDAARNCREILDFFGTVETGRAADAAVERILAWMDKT